MVLFVKLHINHEVRGRFLYSAQLDHRPINTASYIDIGQRLAKVV